MAERSLGLYRVVRVEVLGCARGVLKILGDGVEELHLGDVEISKELMKGVQGIDGHFADPERPAIEV